MKNEFETVIVALKTFFRNSQYRYYYVLLTSAAFSELICSWIGAVADFYMLYTDSLAQTLLTAYQ